MCKLIPMLAGDLTDKNSKLIAKPAVSIPVASLYSYYSVTTQAK